MSEHLVVKSVIDAENIVTEFELKSTTKFTIFRRNKGFSHDFDYADIKGHRVLWEDRGQDEGDKALPYDGIPFIVLGYDVRECHFGPDRNESKKKKQQAEKNMEKNKDHAYSQKSRVLMQNTKKLNCPARIYMRKICKFPEYKIVGPDSSFKRKKQARELKKDMSSQKEMDRVEEYHVFLPGPESHKNHVTGQLAGTCLPVDKVIKEHITTLMEEGVSKVAEMKRHLKSFSRKELRIGDEENRRFYPSDKAIRNTMNSIKDRTRFSSDDKENLQEMVDRFKASNPEDSFYLNITSPEEFLFVGQSEHQKRLLNIYGQEICLLDATYKTTKYSLPAFFVCVNTNVGYSTVGCFITADETKAAIKRGLEYLKQWNKNWNPEFFMTDFDTSEIGAIEETFPGCHVYLCDFHREQAWNRWLKLQANGCAEYKDQILSMFRDIARSATEEDFQQNVETLKCSSLWKNKIKLRNWFERIWLSNSRRWVWIFRKDLFNNRVSTTNGLERQHLKLKQEYLAHTSDKSLSSLVQILFTQVFPDSYNRYVDYNARSLETMKAYASVVPRFLRNRPKMLVEHCVKRIPPHVEMAAEKDIQQCMDGKFQVKSLNSDNVYDIDLSAHCPSCSCPDWKKHRLPCKHMLAIFHHFPAWDWDFLPSDYRDAPHFNLDFEVLNQLQDIFPTHQTCPGELLNQQEQSGRGRGKKRPFPKEPEVTPLTNDWEKCRELVKTIQSRLMNSYGHDLSTIVGPLQQVADQLKEIEPKDDDLPVIRPLKRKRVPNKCGNIRKTGVLNSSGLPHQRSKRKLLRKQNKGPGERIDQGIMKNLQSCVAADADDIEVSKELNRLWNQKENSGYIIAKCGGVNITDEDIASLNGSNWLTDQVIDSYLGAIAEAETEKGNRVLRILTSTMTSILEGGCLQNMTLRNVKLDEYNGIIGAYLQRMGHWNLVVIEPKSRQIAFYNPLGETMHQKTMILQNWSRFFHQRVSLDLESGESSNRWTLNTVNHSKQQDGYNCGVYVLLFCEKHLSKETPDRITAEVLKSSRMRIAKHLLMYQVYLKDCCPSCGFEIQQSQNEIRCEICNRKFHKLPFCLKEEVHFDHFTCRQCSLSIGDEVSTEFHDYAPCDDQMEEEHTHQCSTSDNLHSPGQAVDILRPFREAVLKSNFSENDCSEMVDAMKHCGWNSITNTAQALGKELPPFPNHIQLKFSGYQCLGNFGDGYIHILPQSLRRDEVPLLTGCSPHRSLFASVSVLLYGDINKLELLRLATICREIGYCSSDQKNLIHQEMKSTIAPCDAFELREMHLQAISTLTNRSLSVRSKTGTRKYYPSDVTETVALPGLNLFLLLLPLKGDTVPSFLPVVDGCLAAHLNRRLSD